MNADESPKHRHLLERGWRLRPGLGWVDPASITATSLQGVAWSLERAIKIEALRDALKQLCAAGWKIVGEETRPEVVTKSPMLYDSRHQLTYRRVCVLKTALEQQRQRDALAAGWPFAPAAPPPLVGAVAMASDDSPERFLDLPAAQQAVVLLWVRKVMQPATTPSRVKSRLLRVFCQDEVVFAVSNGAMKGAMLIAGIDPLDARAPNASYEVRPLRPSNKGNKRSMARCWRREPEVYTLLDAEETTREQFLQARALALQAAPVSPPARGLKNGKS